MLNIAYQGDIGWLFCGDVLIADNFCNGETWQVGLREGNIVDGGPPGAVRCVRR